MSETINVHPSYAMASFSRVSSGRNYKFFGSDVDCRNWIELEIKKGCEYFRNEEKYPSSIFEEGGSYIRVAFTPTQFAELLTSMNIGEGVPCTLKRINGSDVEEIPEDFSDNALDYQKKYFNEHIEKFSNEVKSMEHDVNELLKKKTLSKVDKEKIMRIFGYVSSNINSNIPFFMDVFKETTDKIVTHAKGEIDATLQHCLVKTGMKALGVNFENKGQKELDAKELKDNGEQ